MAAVPRAVFFDVDGVLIDSLPQHLQICRDKAQEFGLKVRIPDVAEFRALVRRGVKVSPMFDFFLAVGFPESFAERAVTDYERDFMRLYRPRAFPGIAAMLAKLASARISLGIVTSNTAANVMPALGKATQYFDRRLFFFFDRYPEPKAKSWCLDEGARLLNLAPRECIYVGDQPADAAAAERANVRFLGVTYGWGISPEDKNYPTARTVEEVAGKLVGLRVAS